MPIGNKFLRSLPAVKAGNYEVLPKKSPKKLRLTNAINAQDINYKKSLSLVAKLNQGSAYAGLDLIDGTLTLSMSSDKLTAYGGITLSGPSSYFGRPTNGGRLDLGAGNDVLKVVFAGQNILYGLAIDTILQTGEGADYVQSFAGLQGNIFINGLLDTGKDDDVLTTEGNILAETCLDISGTLLLGEGNDNIYVYRPLKSTASFGIGSYLIEMFDGLLDAGPGNDSILADGLGLSEFNFKVFGYVDMGPGDDIITANPIGSGTITMGPGNDVVVADKFDLSVLNFGDGVDSFYLGAGEYDVTAKGDGVYELTGNEHTIVELSGLEFIGAQNSTSLVPFSAGNFIIG